jgi:predicted small integral membrane protein
VNLHIQHVFHLGNMIVLATNTSHACLALYSILSKICMPFWNIKNYFTNLSMPYMYIWRLHDEWQVHHFTNMNTYFADLISQYRCVKSETKISMLTQLHGAVLIENLIIIKLGKKFLEFYGTQRSIIVFTKAHHWSQSWAGWIQSTPSHPISNINFNIILPSTTMSLKWSLFFRFLD